MKWVRVFAKANPEEWDGNWDIMLDVIVNDNGIVKAGLNYFGICGGFQPDSVMPILLRADGDVDFGCAVGPDETKLSRLNIHQRTIQIGEYFTHFHDGDEVVLKITKVTNLIED